MPVATLNNPGPALFEEFGFSVAIDGMRAAIGAPYDDSAQNDKGSAYIYGSGNATLPVAVSRKFHGSTPFEVPLPLTGAPGVECRSGGTAGAHQIVVTFLNTVTFANAVVTAGGGSVSSATASGTQITVELTGVANAQTITLTLTGVNDGTNFGNIAIPMGMLFGDTNGNRSVTASDISQVKAQSGQPVTAANFRADLNANGSLNATDVSAAKTASGSGLP